MAELPSEVITDILSRLPVKPLLRFRSTCKWWRFLIDSTNFTFQHLNKSMKNSTIILLQHSRVYQLDLETLDKVVELNHPLMCYSNRIKVLGSCNGLICICNIADDIAFWNPSIRKHRILPSEPLNRHESDEKTLLAARVYGFGYDSFSDDYKLVSISSFLDLHRRGFDSQVRLYSLRLDAWKTLPSMPYALCHARTMGVFVGCSLHWVVTRKLQLDQPDLVVAFDLRHESFREVSLPVTVNGNYEMDVALLGGCLCVIEKRGDTQFDVWVMREYGSQDSWCKLFTVDDMRSVTSLRPLAYSRDGDNVLLEEDRSKLCGYDLKSKRVTCVRIQGMPSKIEGIVCVGSLVPPNLLNRSDDDARNCEQHKFRKKRDDFLSKGFRLSL